MIQKSYNDTPTLYLIPTPIGNMKDITYRSVEILKEVDVLFCEDTRVTSILLKNLEITKKMISSHKYNEREKKDKVLEYLKLGNNVGLVSDRGTPIVSDPGYEVARYIIENGFNVVSLPGATAFLPALTSSGIDPYPFIFFGFLDSKENERKKQLENLMDYDMTLIFYESPHRLLQTLKNMYEILGNRRIAISREITKKFEEIIRSNIEDTIDNFKPLKGEIVIIVEGSKEIENSLSISENVNLYIKQGFSAMEAIKKTAKERKIPKSKVYEEYHNLGGTK